ncbi:MAG TPA: S41 family peptidase [bacterium]|nr:S41 family peptidase [bacterium]HQL62510.1 S41 family peptidase [bacterium]
MSRMVRRGHMVLLWMVSLVILGVMGLGVHSTVMAVENIETKMEQSDLFLEVMATIEESYIDEEKTKPDILIEKAIQGMVEGLDRYSVFFTQEEAKEFNDQTQGEFEGLGIQINLTDGWLTVVQTLHGTPAERAGILEGDRIIEIDGQGTKGISLQEAVKKLKGPKGTKVKLRIARRSETQLLTFEVERDVINPSAIINPKMLDNEVGYMRLQDFSKDAARELEKYIRELEGKGMRALVLDLRDNYGGLLDVAVDACDLFIERGKVIVTYRGRGDQVKEYTAKRDPVGHILLAVLVNEFSASASEIVAGCMQDYKRAVIVGSAGSMRDGKPDPRTFGKGSVQTLIPLSTKGGRGAMLKLTTAKYYTPKGRSISDLEGLIPDILANVTPDEHYSIRLNRKYGVLPPNVMKSAGILQSATGTPQEPNAEPKGPTETPSSSEEQEKELTPGDIFKEGAQDSQQEEPKEEVYDTELLAAYQSLKTALILIDNQAGEVGLARPGN